MAARESQQHQNELSEETSNGDDDFVLESLPDTDELEDEPSEQEEQPYEAESA
jgi:hypothetical protein